MPCVAHPRSAAAPAAAVNAGSRGVPGGPWLKALLPRPCTGAGSGKRVAELLLLLLFGFEVKK